MVQSYDNIKIMCTFVPLSLNLSKRYPMRSIHLILLVLLTSVLLTSCKKEIKLNDDWKDVTIVYGILNQQDSIHYLKITKAFLGSGNALQYAQIADSSNYMYELDVKLEAHDANGIVSTYRFDTATIHDKDSGTFYFPNQLIYANDSVLDPQYMYKLYIKNPVTQKIIESETVLVQNFYVDKPRAYQKLTFDPGKSNKVEWTSAVGGKLYQIVVRFYYLETSISDPSYSEEKYVDWVIIPGYQSMDDLGGDEIIQTYSNDGFYAALGSSIPVNPDMQRVARILKYYFIVAADDLNTYIEVTEPSNSIIQEKPAYSNIENGIGLFSARYVQIVDSCELSPRTEAELKVNSNTSDLGF
jgi:hypothetical protein